MFSGVERTLDLNITQSMLADWESGTLIQEAMPQLNADEREFIMTGVTTEDGKKIVNYYRAFRLID